MNENRLFIWVWRQMDDFTGKKMMTNESDWQYSDIFLNRITVYNELFGYGTYLRGG